MWISTPVLLLGLLLLACTPTPPSGGSPVECAAVSSTQTTNVDTTVYDSTGVDTPPRRLAGPVPHYPDEPRQNGRNGRVVLEFIVDAHGRAEPASMRVIQYSEWPFVSVTLDAIRMSVFCPAIRHGAPVRCRLRMPVNYKIAGSGDT